jgi:hypothetical protein
MALKVKAVERLLKFDKESAGKYRYVMMLELYTALAQDKVVKEAALRSGFARLLSQGRKSSFCVSEKSKKRCKYTIFSSFLKKVVNDCNNFLFCVYL